MAGEGRLKDGEKFKVKMEKKVLSLLKNIDVLDILSNGVIIGIVGIATMLVGFLGGLIAKFVREPLLIQVSIALLIASIVLLILSIIILFTGLLILYIRHNGD